MYRHPCGESLRLSLQVNNILSALKKNRCARGTAGVLNSRHSESPAAEMSLDHFGRFSMCENRSSSHTRRAKEAKESQGEISLFRTASRVGKSHSYSSSPSSSTPTSSASPTRDLVRPTLKSSEMKKRGRRAYQGVSVLCLHARQYKDN